MNLHNTKTMTIEVERFIEATPAEIFDAWLDRSVAGSPWNGVSKVIMQPIVDGLFYRMHMSENGDFELAHYGRFLVLNRPSTIKYTWMSQHTRGIESVVTVQLHPGRSTTRVLLTHENLPADEEGRMHEGGWNHYLGQMSHSLQHRSAKDFQ